MGTSCMIRMRKICAVFVHMDGDNLLVFLTIGLKENFESTSYFCLFFYIFFPSMFYLLKLASIYNGISNRNSWNMMNGLDDFTMKLIYAIEKTTC